MESSLYVLTHAAPNHPKAKTDELAFPIRMKIAVSPYGLGSGLVEAHQWLKDEIGAGSFPMHTLPGFAHETAFHFRSVEKAGRFLAAFPALQMADTTISLRGLTC